MSRNIGSSLPPPEVLTTPEPSFFETLFNMTLDIDGKLLGTHKAFKKEHFEDDPCSRNSDGCMLNFTISKTWKGQYTTDATHLSLSRGENQTVVVSIMSEYFDDPAPPSKAGGKKRVKRQSTTGGPFLQLWNYETVELFFLNDADQYLEVQLGPHGHYQVILLVGRRKVLR